MTYQDELIQAIRRKFAPDLMSALRDSDDVLGLSSPRSSVNLPLRADVRVLYDKNLAAFIVRGRVLNTDKNGFECWEGLFANETIGKASDRAAAVDFLFEKAKREFIRSIAEGELASILDDPNRQP